MDKRTVYVETSIVSYLPARPTNDLLVAAWQKATVDWWDTQRIRSDLYTSNVTLEEAGRGQTDAYEDWYLVQDFGALGLLNEAAVSASRAAPHDTAAAVAAGGAGGLYGLRGGVALRQLQYAHWFGKPDGMSYSALFAQLAPVVEHVEGALWMRQMVLGPAQEFCLHAAAPISMPAVFSVLVMPLRQAWPELASKAMEQDE